MWRHLLLAKLMGMSISLKNVLQQFNNVLRSDTVSAIMIKSSAYIKALIQNPFTKQHTFVFLRESNIPSTKTAKSDGLRIPPCRTPALSKTGADKKPFHNTQVVVLLNQFSSILTIPTGVPLLRRTVKRA